ncbi:transcription termination factor MTEF18, mitochondrial [Cryptomeria japonica]|uniref:transcription termination factor MTEF18, mitochondrial n=1 Tax=Cryptomeria japonica TaxID=3369 RepID=UPI0027DA4B11|nr:transcription termination factor MTEF18, mitochondrial [Cryptomeria japonica]
MPAQTMLFLKCILSPFRYYVLLKCSSFSASKFSDAISSNRPRTEAEEYCRRKIAMTQFLLNECGFSESQVLAIGRRDEDLFKVISIRTAQQAVQLFRDSGFTEDQVRKIVLLQPNTIKLKVHSQLKPKIEFMKALGFTGSDLAHIISQEPRFLGCNLEQNLNPKVPLLVGIFGSKLNLYKIIMRYPRVLMCNTDNMKPNIDILKQSSMQDELLLCNHGKARFNFSQCEKPGILEGSKAFANALAVVDSSGLENFENKLKLLTTLGLLENEILKIVRWSPSTLTVGIDMIKKKMDFLKNTAGFQPNIVVSYPRLLCYSIENRLQPRHKVIEFLSETDPSRLPRSLAKVYGLSEQCFADKFLMGGPEAAKFFEKYKGKSTVC